MIAGVAIDAWKLKIFKKNLDSGGFSYTEKPGLMKDTLLLLVTTDSTAVLSPTIEKAQRECAKWKRKHKLN